MECFDSWHSYRDFERIVEEYKYIPYNEVRNNEVRKFLKTVLATSKERIITIKKDEMFWRARIGSGDGLPRHDEGNFIDYVEEPFKGKEIEAPPPDKTSGGRINPEDGINKGGLLAGRV